MTHIWEHYSTFCKNPKEIWFKQLPLLYESIPLILILFEKLFFRKFLHLGKWCSQFMFVPVFSFFSRDSVILGKACLKMHPNISNQFFHNDTGWISSFQYLAPRRKQMDTLKVPLLTRQLLFQIFSPLLPSIDFFQ